MFVAFDSTLSTTRCRRGGIFGEVIGQFQSVPREFERCIGDGKKQVCCTMLIVRLGTFDKGSIVELPIEAVKCFDTEQEAKDYGRIEQ